MWFSENHDDVVSRHIHRSTVPDFDTVMAPLIKLIDENNLQCDLQIDGGIDLTTAPIAARAGANVLVAGNAIFAKDDPLQAAKDIRAAGLAAR